MTIVRIALRDYPELVIGLDDNDAVVSRWIDPVDPRQYWFKFGDGLGNFYLVNEATNRGLRWDPEDGKTAKLSAVGLPGDTWNAPRLPGAIRWATNTDVNLDVKGGIGYDREPKGLGAPIVGWGWSNGSNQNWTIQEPLNDTPIETRTVIIYTGGGNAVLQNGGGTFPGRLHTASASWPPTAGPETPWAAAANLYTKFEMTIWKSCVSFAQVLGPTEPAKVLTIVGRTRSVEFIPLDGGKINSMSQAWTLATDSDGRTAIRAYATDGLNLNVYEGRLGEGNNAGIIVWGWGGGKDNEVWHIVDAKAPFDQFRAIGAPWTPTQ